MKTDHYQIFHYIHLNHFEMYSSRYGQNLNFIIKFLFNSKRLFHRKYFTKLL